MDEDLTRSPDLATKWRSSTLPTSLGVCTSGSPSKRLETDPENSEKPTSVSLSALLGRAHASSKRVTRRQVRLYEEKLKALTPLSIHPQNGFSDWNAFRPREVLEDGNDEGARLMPHNLTEKSPLGPHDTPGARELHPGLLESYSAKGCFAEASLSKLSLLSEKNDDEIQRKPVDGDNLPAIEAGNENASLSMNEIGTCTPLEPVKGEEFKKDASTPSASVNSYSASRTTSLSRSRKRVLLYDDEPPSPWSGRTRSSAKKTRSPSLQEATPVPFAEFSNNNRCDSTSFSRPTSQTPSTVKGKPSKKSLPPIAPIANLDSATAAEPFSAASGISLMPGQVRTSAGDSWRARLSGIAGDKSSNGSTRHPMMAPGQGLKVFQGGRAEMPEHPTPDQGATLDNGPGVVLSLFATGKGTSIKVSAETMARASLQVTAPENKGPLTVGEAVERAFQGSGGRNTRPNNLAQSNVATFASGRTDAQVSLDLFSTGRGSAIKVAAATVERTRSQFGHESPDETDAAAANRIAIEKASWSSVSSSAATSRKLDYGSGGPTNDFSVSASPSLLTTPQPLVRRQPLHRLANASLQTTRSAGENLSGGALRATQRSSSGRTFNKPRQASSLPTPVMSQFRASPLSGMMIAPCSQPASTLGHENGPGMKKHRQSRDKHRTRLPALVLPLRSVLAASSSLINRISAENALNVSFAPSFEQEPVALLDQPCRATVQLLSAELLTMYKNASLDWVANHYRWIVLQAAAVERLRLNKSRLTLDLVRCKLKARAEREWIKMERSAVWRVVDGETFARCSMVLFVSRILPIVDVSNGSLTVEVSDGWYAVRCSLDAQLSQRVLEGRIRVGQKVLLSNCEPIRDPQGARIDPLQLDCNRPLHLSSGAVQFSLSATINCAKPAPWDAPLGILAYKPSTTSPIFPRQASLRLSRIRIAGGTVPRVEVRILRRSMLMLREIGEKGTFLVRCHCDAQTPVLLGEPGPRPIGKSLQCPFENRAGLVQNCICPAVSSAEESAPENPDLRPTSFLRILVTDAKSDHNEGDAAEAEEATATIMVERPNADLLSRIYEGATCIVSGLRAEKDVFGLRLIAEPEAATWIFPPSETSAPLTYRTYGLVEMARSEVDTVLVSVHCRCDLIIAMRLDGSESLIVIKPGGGQSLPTLLRLGARFAVRDLFVVGFNSSRSIFECLCCESTLFVTSVATLSTEMREAFSHLIPMLDQASERIADCILERALTIVAAAAAGSNCDAQVESTTWPGQRMSNADPASERFERPTTATRNNEFVADSSCRTRTEPSVGSASCRMLFSPSSPPVAAIGQVATGTTRPIEESLAPNRVLALTSFSVNKEQQPLTIMQIMAGIKKSAADFNSDLSSGATMAAGSVLDATRAHASFTTSPTTERPNSVSINMQVSSGSSARNIRLTLGVTSEALASVMVGKKVVEARLNKGRFAQVRPGWELRFECGPQFQEVDVVAVREYPSFRQMVEVESVRRVSPWLSTNNEASAQFSRVFGSLDMECGVVVFEIRCKDALKMMAQRPSILAI